MSGYCAYAAANPLHGPYHDAEYGVPETDETRLFERLMLEITQAGLNWGLVLQKRASLAAAYAGFDVDKVAAFHEADRERLLADPGVVRNALKVNAAIHNARVVQGLRDSHGGFAAWLAAHHPRRKEDWVKLFKKTFKFTGGEITGSFLIGIGYLPGAHAEDCPRLAAIDGLAPPWRGAPAGFWA